MVTADASIPNCPPLSHAGPVSDDWTKPLPCADEPETTMPSTGPCTTFQAKCSPMTVHRLRVNAYSAANSTPASSAIPIAPNQVASGLPRWAAPKTSALTAIAIQLPKVPSTSLNKMPRKAISSVIAAENPRLSSAAHGE